MWSIHHGELNLSRAILKAGFAPKILYHGSQLSPHLKLCSLQELASAIGLLPTFFRQQLYEDLMSAAAHGTGSASGSTFDALLVTSKSLAKSFRNTNVHGGDANFWAESSAHVMDLLHQMVGTYGDIYDAVRIELIQGILKIVNSRNQMHVGGFLFMKYLKMPALKRDLFYREVYRLEDIDEILTLAQVPLKEEIMADLRQRGTQAHLRGIRKIMGWHGAI